MKVKFIDSLSIYEGKTKNNYIKFCLKNKINFDHKLITLYNA